MKTIQSLIGGWNAATFPDATGEDFIKKLYEELDEASAEYHGMGELPEELADIAIVLLSFADRRGIDLEEEILAKMKTNQVRALEGRWRVK